MAEQKDESRDTMTFMEHLEELRQRLIKCLTAVIVGVFVCWFFREELRQFLEAPLYEAWRTVPGLPAPSPLSFTSLMEPFVAYLKIAAIGGVFFAAPVIFYQLWRFVSPGLYKKEKRMALPFVLVSSVLFIVGSAGAYAYVFPLGFSFFLQFSSGGTTDIYETGKLAMIQEEIGQPSPKKTEKRTTVSKKRTETLDTELGDTRNKTPDAAESIDGTESGTNAALAAAETDSDSDTAKNDTDINNPKSQKKAASPKKAAARKTKKTASARAKQKEKRAAKPDAREKTETGKWEKARRLYAWVEKKLGGESCGHFRAAPHEKKVLLRYEHSVKRCGAAPVALRIERNGKPTALTMVLVSDHAGKVVFETEDYLPGVKSVSYRLLAIREASKKLLPVLMVKDYLDFAVKLMLAFGLVFELPILIFFLAYAGIVDYIQLIRFGRWFVVLSLVLAAILTPPDVVTQILLATPLVLLYYLSIAVVFFLGRKRKGNE